MKKAPTVRNAVAIPIANLLLGIPGYPGTWNTDGSSFSNLGIAKYFWHTRKLLKENPGNNHFQKHVFEFGNNCMLCFDIAGFRHTWVPGYPGRNSDSKTLFPSVPGYPGYPSGNEARAEPEESEFPGPGTRDK
eukprot:1155325-Rhodomonas_salina.1